MRIDLRHLLLAVLGAGLVACGAGSLGAELGSAGYGGGADAGRGGALPCASTADCASGLICVSNQCVSSADQHPPEQGSTVTGPPPAATPDYVFALDPAGAQAVRIDARTLAIEAIPLGGSPVEIDALPTSDRVLVLNSGNDQLHLLDATDAGPTVRRNIALDRRQDHLRLSPDGDWAVCFTDPNTSPDQGAEGIVTVVQLASSGTSAGTAFDRAAGYRVSDVFFRSTAGSTRGAVVVALDTVSFIDLSQGSVPALPPRLSLPASASADLASRSVVATPDGAYVLIRSFTAQEITVVDVDAQTLAVLNIPDIATDLEVEPGGTAAVVVMRATAQVEVLAIPKDLGASGNPALISLGSFKAGQIVLSPVADPSRGPFGLLFTNATPSMEIARLDLSTGTVTDYPDTLQKLVQGVGISPDGKAAIVVHRPDPNPATTDPYAAQVAKDQGYSMFDFASAAAQLKRTGKVAVQAFAFAPQGGAAAVALSDTADQIYGVDALNLSTLVSSSLSLASPPEYVGAVPQQVGNSSDPYTWVTQAYSGGRISFVDLSTLALETVTGFELNSQIQN